MQLYATTTYESVFLYAKQATNVRRSTLLISSPVVLCMRFFCLKYCPPLLHQNEDINILRGIVKKDGNVDLLQRIYILKSVRLNNICLHIYTKVNKDFQEKPAVFPEVDLHGWHM